MSDRPSSASITPQPHIAPLPVLSSLSAGHPLSISSPSSTDGMTPAGPQQSSSSQRQDRDKDLNLDQDQDQRQPRRDMDHEQAQQEQDDEVQFVSSSQPLANQTSQAGGTVGVGVAPVDQSQRPRPHASIFAGTLLDPSLQMPNGVGRSMFSQPRGGLSGPQKEKRVEVHGFGGIQPGVVVGGGAGPVNGFVDGNGISGMTTPNAVASTSTISPSTDGVTPKLEQPSARFHPRPNSSAQPIDLTSDSPDPTPSGSPHPFSAPAPPAASRQPLCIGSIDSMALVLYPSALMQKGERTDDLVRTGDVRRTNDGEEWVRVRLKYRKPKHGRAGEETISILSANQTTVIGVTNETMLAMLKDVLERGLARLEGHVKRGDITSMFTAQMNILIFTLPSNVDYLSKRMASHTVYLDHPLPYYIPANHADTPPYNNPHHPPPEGWRVSKKARTDALLAAGRSGMAIGKTVEVQREQVDQVFRSLKGGDELEETEPGPLIKTALFGHQKKAITFLLQREQEKSAIKAAEKAAERAVEKKTEGLLNVDAEDMKEESKKKLKREKRMIRKKGINSLWEPVESGGKIRAWRNLVTEQLHEGRERPKDMRGAILADDMGLGKTLSIVSLIASTLRSARKFGGGEVSRPDSDDSDSDDEDPDLSPSHFGGAVFGMPDTNSDGGSSVNGGHKRKRLSKKEKHAVQRLEAKHRASRLLTRTRATLLVCPLSTVTNWEDQIKEHWKGEVMVIGGAATPPSEAEFRAAESDVLKVYVYHGTARRADPTYLAQFDIVITTFSTLQTEYSRQLKSATNSQAGSAAPSPAPEDDGCDDEVIEVDEDGVPAIKEGQKLEVETERLQMEKSEKAAKGKRKRGLDDYDLGVAKTGSEVVSPLQAVEWFRVVLDEAHFIKDATTIVSRAACYLEAERRIALTGTPIQNKLDDVWALIKFLRFAPFDDKSVWTQYILGLAKAGNSLGVARLQTILKHCTLRRTKESTNANGEKILNLPPRREEIREIEFSPKEREVYDKYFARSKEEFIQMQKDSGKGSFVNVLHQILQLRQICDHWMLPNDASDEMLEDDIIAEAEESMDAEEVRAAIAQDGNFTFRRALAFTSSLKENGALVCGSCNSDLEVPEMAKPEEDVEEEPAGKKTKGKKKAKGGNYPLVTKCLHVFCLPCFKSGVLSTWPRNANIYRHCPSCHSQIHLLKEVLNVTPDGPDGQASKATKKRTKTKIGSGPEWMSAKMTALLTDLMEFSQSNPDSSNYQPWSQDVQEFNEEGKPVVTKTVVFSQWTTMLDHIENMLRECNIGCARLDGTMKREERAEAMDKLRNDPKVEVLLVSLRAGGVGLNLTAATRCYLIDPYWNPSVENQAVDRIHRLGQKRSVISTKFVIKDTIEGKMLEVQKRKAELAKLSLSQTISKKDLHERRLEDLKMLFS